MASEQTYSLKQECVMESIFRLDGDEISRSEVNQAAKIP